MCYRCFLPVILGLASLGAGSQGTNRSDHAAVMTNERAAIAEYAGLVNRYVELHRMLAAQLGEGLKSSNPEDVQRAAQKLASAIRAERSAAKMGDIFTPAVASLFRHRIAAAMRGADWEIDALLNEVGEDDVPVFPRLEVNGPFPWAAGNLVWPSMRLKLPPTPPEIEYRFVGRDLVLLDVRANLVIDILENALSIVPLEEPCIVHPELPACWT